MSDNHGRAAGRRWLETHVGRTIDTVQVDSRWGREWRPGPRVLARRNKSTFTLDGSTVSLSNEHTVPVVAVDHIVTVWHDADGTPIHTTTYTLITETP